MRRTKNEERLGLDCWKDLKVYQKVYEKKFWKKILKF
jgi:hypothetical protein